MTTLKGIDFFELENTIWIAEKKVNVPLYDFAFSPLFQIARPRSTDSQEIVARIGAIENYENISNTFKDIGYKLINSPQEHLRASELEHWYPLIQQHTPRSVVFEQIPTAKQILTHFDFPIFIKGNRQTAKHQAKLAIANNLSNLETILKAYQQNSILHWQKLVCREYVSLKKMDYQAQNTVPISFEFRTFWWKGNLVGCGPYWGHLLHYDWTKSQKNKAIEVATQACQRLEIPFLVIDLALTDQNDWIIIECNDGQESGYAGVDVAQMWRNILILESS